MRAPKLWRAADGSAGIRLRGVSTDGSDPKFGRLQASQQIAITPSPWCFPNSGAWEESLNSGGSVGRSVAQPGSALASGARGRRFESSRSDQTFRWLS